MRAADDGGDARGAILITGAAGGLGAELARGLASAGYAVVGLARSADRLRLVESEIASAGGVFVPVVGDARDDDALREAVRLGEEQAGGLYGAIANAGIAGPTAPLAEISLEEWTETLDVNVTSVFQLCRVAGPVLCGRGRGRIVIVGSVTGKRPLLGRTPYAASKLALVGLARTLALELGPSGVTVNVISPWLLEGSRLDAVVEAQAVARGLTAAAVRQEMLAGTATGSPVSPDDVLCGIEFLLDPRNGNLTGQDLNLSAGAVMY